MIPSVTQDHILGDMADIMIKSLIHKCKRVTRSARKETVASYGNAETLLKDCKTMGTEQESVVINIVMNCRKLGMKYGKMKLWQMAHKELERAVQYLKSHDKIYHSRMFCEQTALLKGALGSLWLEQYKQSAFHGLREDTDRLKMLKKPEGYTLETLYKLIDAEQCIEDSKLSLHCMFNHDYARQCYVLGTGQCCV